MKIVVIVLCVVDFLLLCLLFMNREGSKIFETVLTITLVMIGALVFATVEQKIRKDFNTAYFVSNIDLVPLFSLPNSDYLFESHYVDQMILFNNHTKRLSEQYKSVPFNYRLSEYRPLIELQAIAVLDYLAKNYARHWLTERETTELPTGTSVTYRTLEDSKESVKDLAFYKKEDLPNSWNENMFFQDFTPWLDSIAVPKGTRINYVFVDGTSPFSQIILTKPLWFTMTITIRFSIYTVGLGKMMRILVIDKSQGELDHDALAKEQGKYGCVVLRVTCEARFNRLLSGNPSMLLYRQWVSKLSEDFSNRFDWTHLEEKIKDRRESLAVQKILEAYR